MAYLTPPSSSSRKRDVTRRVNNAPVYYEDIYETINPEEQREGRAIRSEPESESEKDASSLFTPRETRSSKRDQRKAAKAVPYSGRITRSKAMMGGKKQIPVIKLNDGDEIDYDDGGPFVAEKQDKTAPKINRRQSIRTKGFGVKKHGMFDSVIATPAAGSRPQLHGNKDDYMMSGGLGDYVEGDDVPWVVDEFTEMGLIKDERPLKSLPQPAAATAAPMLSKHCRKGLIKDERLLKSPPQPAAAAAAPMPSSHHRKEGPMQDERPLKSKPQPSAATAAPISPKRYPKEGRIARPKSRILLKQQLAEHDRLKTATLALSERRAQSTMRKKIRVARVIVNRRVMSTEEYADMRKA